MTDNGIQAYMPVGPTNGMGDMFGGNNGWWILILLVLFGWNGNGGYGGNYGSEIQRGFDQNSVMNGITGIQNAITSGFQNAETAATSRQLADMNQMFALQSALQNYSCMNQTGLADLKYAVGSEACADRNAISMALRDILEANNASTQKILDVMCQDKIDAKNETIANLRQQLQMAQLAASQGAQTATILANNDAQTAALEQYLAPAPRPAYIVQNPNGCSQTYTCGCNAA